MIPCYCLPDSASKGSLAGPIGPARYLLLARKDQQNLEDLENVAENVEENMAESLHVFPVLLSVRAV